MYKRNTDTTEHKHNKMSLKYTFYKIIYHSKSRKKNQS